MTISGAATTLSNFSRNLGANNYLYFWLRTSPYEIFKRKLNKGACVSVAETSWATGQYSKFVFATVGRWAQQILVGEVTEAIFEDCSLGS